MNQLPIFVLVGAAVLFMETRSHIPLRFQAASRFGEESHFVADVSSGALPELSDDALMDLPLVVNTGAPTTWLELGGVFDASPTDDFTPIEGDATISALTRIGLVEFMSDWRVRNEYPTTYGKGVGQLGASLSSAFANAVGNFSVVPGLGTSFDLVLGPKDVDREWTTVPVVEGETVRWLVKGLVQVGSDSEFKSAIFNLNSGFRGIALPHSLYSELTDILRAMGGRVSSLYTTTLVHNCPHDSLPPITVQLGNVTVAVPLIDEIIEGGCTLAVHGQDEDVVELGGAFFEQTAVHFDRLARTVSFSPLVE